MSKQEPQRQPPKREGPNKGALQLVTGSGKDLVKKLEVGKKPQDAPVVTPAPVVMPARGGGPGQKKYEIVKRDVEQVARLVILKPFMYTWDEVLALASEKYDFPDIAAKQVHFATINRFNYPGPSNRPSTVPKPDVWRSSIIAGLNKLTPNTYFDVIDELTAKHPDGSNPEFLKLLAQNLWEYGKEQTVYTVIFGDFVAGVKIQLNNDLQDKQRAAFLDTFLGCVNDFLANKMKGAKQVNGPRFVGYLAHNNTVELGTVMDALENLVKDPITSDDLESASNMYLACGDVLMKKFGERAEEFVKTLETLRHQRESFTTRVRFFILDVLDKVRSGVPVRVRLGSNTTNTPKDDTAKATKVQGESKIAVGKNKFSVLGDDDDEDEEDEVSEEDNGPEQLVMKYIVDRSVGNSKWTDTQESRQELMRVIALQSQHANIAVGLLSDLRENGDSNRFDPNEKEALEALKETVAFCRDEEKKHPGCVRNCGLILAQLVIMDIVQADKYGEVFPEYRPDIVAAFLKKLCEGKGKLGAIRESSYWSNYNWRPEIMVSHLEIAKTLAENEDLLSVFELYEHLFGMSCLLQDYISGAEVEIDDKMVQLTPEFIDTEIKQNIPPEVVESVSFAVGIMEILMEYEASGDLIKQFFGYLKPKAAEMLCWVEWYGWSTHMQPEQISQRISNLCNIGNIDPAPYVAMQGTVIHDKVIAGVQLPKA